MTIKLDFQPIRNMINRLRMMNGHPPARFFRQTKLEEFE